MDHQPSSDYVKLDISCYETFHEKRFPKSLAISELASKLELLCGITADSMLLTLHVDDHLPKALTQSDSSLTLSSVLPSTWEKLRLDVKDSTGRPTEFDDLSKVEKFDLTADEYAQRSDTVRAFKEKNKLGRFDEEAEAKKEQERLTKEKLEEEKSLSLKTGDRVEVRVFGQPTRRGAIRYVGTTKFKPGVWVGVQYDEPLGKNDGSVAGHRYFDCPPKYGGFVRPTDLQVGDYPEEVDFDEI